MIARIGSDLVAKAEGTVGQKTTSKRKQEEVMSPVVQLAKRKKGDKFVCYCFPRTTQNRRLKVV